MYICSSVWRSRPPSPPTVAFLRSPMEARKPEEKLRKHLKTKESHGPTKMYHMFQHPAPRESNLHSFLVVFLCLYHCFHIVFSLFFLLLFTWFSLCFHMMLSLFPCNFLLVSSWLPCGCLTVVLLFSFCYPLVFLWFRYSFLNVLFREPPPAPTPTGAHPTDIFKVISK